MDLILEKYFEKFVNEQQLLEGKTSKNFEKFVNYICLSTKNISNFDLLSSCVGNGSDAGIDGIGISVNNRYVNNKSELEDILNKHMEYSIEFFFVQSKTSECFSTKEIGIFGDGVADLFRPEDETKKMMNESVKEKYNMIQMILDNYEYIKSMKCMLYYVTPGVLVEDDNQLSTKNRIIETIFNLGIFDRDAIELNLFDRTYIRKQYEATKIQNTATFELNNKIEIPYIEKVSEAYLAIMSVKEYLNLIVDENDRIRRGIFELNVRDFAGSEDNRVNQDIIGTLNSDNKDSFGLLNNGITIVGKSLSKGMGKYTIKNFYIVNGCQTSNVLYENRSLLTDEMWLSVKIVITQDDQIIKNIVKATNNQTEVQEIQLLSMDEYQEELESFFDAYDKYTHLYYERRDGQYRDRADVPSSRIVNPEMQMKAFASVFLDMPHIASRFSGKLQDEVSKKIFIKEHRPIMYYTSSLLIYKLDLLFKEEYLESVYYKFKFHIATIVSHLVWKSKMPAKNAYVMDIYCEELIKGIEDEVVFKENVLRAKECIDRSVKNVKGSEANKTLEVLNKMLLFAETGWDERDINQAEIFINQVDDYIYPFAAMMQNEGDLRFNFEKNVEYIKVFVTTKSVVNKMVSDAFFETLVQEVNRVDITASRVDRKRISGEILQEFDAIKKRISEIMKKVVQFRQIHSTDNVY